MQMTRKTATVRLYASLVIAAAATALAGASYNRIPYGLEVRENERINMNDSLLYVLHYLRS